MRQSYMKASCGMVILAAIGLGAAVGCSSHNNGQSAAAMGAIDGIKTVRQSLVDGEKQIDATLAALNQLPTATDLPAAFGKFTTEFKTGQDNAAKVKARAADLRERRREYINQWEEKTGDVSDPSMRASMEDRQQRVREKFNSIQSSIQGASDTAKTYVAHLKDIQTALSLDLNPAGVQAVAPTIAKANTEGQALKKDIETAIAHIDEVNGSMTTPPPAAK